MASYNTDNLCRRGWNMPPGSCLLCMHWYHIGVGCGVVLVRLASSLSLGFAWVASGFCMGQRSLPQYTYLVSCLHCTDLVFGLRIHMRCGLSWLFVVLFPCTASSASLHGSVSMECSAAWCCALIRVLWRVAWLCVPVPSASLSLVGRLVTKV